MLKEVIDKEEDTSPSLKSLCLSKPPDIRRNILNKFTEASIEPPCWWYVGVPPWYTNMASGGWKIRWGLDTQNRGLWGDKKPHFNSFLYVCVLKSQKRRTFL